MFSKGFPSGICFCSGSNPWTPKTLIERKYQVVEKEEDNMHPRDLHEQEDIFDDDEDDTITVSGKTVKIVCYDF